MKFRGSNGFQNTLKAALLAAALMLGATAAHAADVCYRGVDGTPLVFKKFKLPRAGECSPISGFQQDSNCILVGAACGTSDGFLVYFNFNQICRFDPLGGAYSFNTDRSIQEGDALFCHQSTSTGQFSCPTFHAARVTCPTTENLAE
jgi:hypothetical protein